MARQMWLLVITVLATGLIAAGCGGDDDDEDGGNGGGDQPAQTQTETQPETDTGEGDETTDGDVQQAIEECQQRIEDTPNLSEDLKSDLQEICEEAASGDEEAVRDAARDVCIRIVEETVPEGQARDQALETCEQAAP